jgi:hypothetical protein
MLMAFSPSTSDKSYSVAGQIRPADKYEVNFIKTDAIGMLKNNLTDCKVFFETE